MAPDNAVTAADAQDTCDPACNVRARAGLRARELARAQCTLGEIEAALVVDLGLAPEDAADVVAEIGELLALECHAGRAGLRSYLWRLANGEAEARKVTSTVVALAEMLGRQHLGYTGQGVDESIRKRVESFEREASKHAGSRGPQLVTGGRAA